MLPPWMTFDTPFNLPAWDQNPSGGCNLPNLLSSADLTTWSKFGSPVPTIASVGGELPGAVRMTINGTSNLINLDNSHGTTIGLVYTFSVYIKGETVTAFTIYNYDGTGVNGQVTPSSFPAAWVRWSFTFTAAQTRFDVVLQSNDSTVGHTILLAEPMLNVGPAPCTWKAP